MKKKKKKDEGKHLLFQDFRKHKKVKEFQLPEYNFELTVDIIIYVLECLQGLTP